MSAKTTATINIVDGELFVNTCIECGIETHLDNNQVILGQKNDRYYNCKLEYSSSKQSYVLDGDSDYIAMVTKRVMPLYNTKHLCNVLNESGRYNVDNESIEQQTDGSYKFRALELEIG